MQDKEKKKNKIVIVNKFKETSTVDIKSTIENAFKIFYELKINKNRI